MNYLEFKKDFPKSLTKFFSWVSTQDPKEQNNYVDNIYLYQFFQRIFLYDYFETQYNDYKGFYIKNPEYLEVLKPIFENKQIGEPDYYGYYYSIVVGKFSNTGNEFIFVKATTEDDYKNVFKVLEILINKGLYA
tara:strand:- start:420 stop:821 length:402 start_codon:yes stop_codon:yes gene_type:complete